MRVIEQMGVDFKKAYLESKNDEAKKLEKDFLGFIRSEFTKESKDPDDAFVISKIKAMIKNSEVKNAQGEVTGECAYSEAEMAILNRYLPTQFTEVELRDIITNEATENGYKHKSDMGKLMSFLKNTYGGQYDGKMASNIVKEILV